MIQCTKITGYTHPAQAESKTHVKTSETIQMPNPTGQDEILICYHV